MATSPRRMYAKRIVSPQHLPNEETASKELEKAHYAQQLRQRDEREKPIVHESDIRGSCLCGECGPCRQTTGKNEKKEQSRLSR